MVKKRKHIPTIRIPIHYVNWGLPKTECLKRLYVMPVRVINFKCKSKKDDIENPSWQRNVRSSQAVNDLITAKGRSYCVPKLKID